jgi:hypothetical protein
VRRNNFLCGRWETARKVPSGRQQTLETHMASRSLELVLLFSPVSAAVAVVAAVVAAVVVAVVAAAAAAAAAAATTRTLLFCFPHALAHHRC